MANQRDELLTVAQVLAAPRRCAVANLLPLAGDRQGTKCHPAPERRAAHLAQRRQHMARPPPRGPCRMKSYDVKFWAIRPGKANFKSVV